MINISHKFNTLRFARAEGILNAPAAVIERVKANTVPKGDVLATARSAGIQAAKRTSDWIVFCHPIPLDWVDLTFELHDTQIRVTAEVETVWKTGVEMEAITAINAALLNMFDMLKPLTDELSFGDIRVVKKKGGKSQYTDQFDTPISAAVLVISDSTFAGTRQDKSGVIIREFLETQPVEVKFYEILPDDAPKISQRLIELVDQEQIQLIFTTGGTGLGPKDVTPEAMQPVIDKEVPGIAEAIRKHGTDRTPYAMLSRGICGLRGQSLIINLPGSSRGATESLHALFPGLLHAYPMMWGGGHSKG